MTSWGKKQGLWGKAREGGVERRIDNKINRTGSPFLETGTELISRTESYHVSCFRFCFGFESPLSGRRRDPLYEADAHHPRAAAVQPHDLCIEEMAPFPHEKKKRGGSRNRGTTQRGRSFQADLSGPKILSRRTSASLMRLFEVVLPSHAIPEMLKRVLLRTMELPWLSQAGCSC